MTKKKARFGALPKLNMPKKTHETPKPEQRPERTIVRDLIKKPQVHYKTFTEFCQRLTKLKSLQNWNIGTFSDRAVLKQVEIPYVLPKFEIVVDDSLAFTVRVYGCYFPEDHPVYLDYRRTVRNISIHSLAELLGENYSLCCGVDTLEMTMLQHCGIVLKKTLWTAMALDHNIFHKTSLCPHFSNIHHKLFSAR